MISVILSVEQCNNDETFRCSSCDTASDGSIAKLAKLAKLSDDWKVYAHVKGKKYWVREIRTGAEKDAGTFKLVLLSENADTLKALGTELRPVRFANFRSL